MQIVVDRDLPVGGGGKEVAAAGVRRVDREPLDLAAVALLEGDRCVGLSQVRGGADAAAEWIGERAHSASKAAKQRRTTCTAAHLDDGFHAQPFHGMASEGVQTSSIIYSSIYFALQRCCFCVHF